jgi:hypothetical protein
MPHLRAPAHADDQQKHYMNQMVAYKQQLEVPLMMGLWKPETCRVEDENKGNKDIKQKSHRLVILILRRIEDARYERQTGKKHIRVQQHQTKAAED